MNYEKYFHKIMLFLDVRYSYNTHISDQGMSTNTINCIVFAICLDYRWFNNLSWGEIIIIIIISNHLVCFCKLVNECVYTEDVYACIRNWNISSSEM